MAFPDEWVMLLLMKEMNCTPVEAVWHMKNFPYLDSLMMVNAYNNVGDAIKDYRRKTDESEKAKDPEKPTGKLAELWETNEARIYKAKRGHGETLGELASVIRDVS